MDTPVCVKCVFKTFQSFSIVIYTHLQMPSFYTSKTRLSNITFLLHKLLYNIFLK